MSFDRQSSSYHRWCARLGPALTSSIIARLGADIVIADIDLQAAREYGEDLTAGTVEAEVRQSRSPRRGHCRKMSPTAKP